MKSDSVRMLLALLLISEFAACTSRRVDKPFIVQVQEIRDSLARAGKTWPGFDAKTIPLLLRDRSQSWLVNHPGPPSGWTPLDEKGSVFSNADPPAGFDRSGTQLLAGVPTTVIVFDTSGHDSLRGYAALALSEALRGFIDQHYPDWKPDEDDFFLYPFTDKTLLKWQMLETESMQEALKALEKGKKDSALTWMSYAVATRDSFDTEADQLSREFVRLMELHDGLPWYVEVQARGLMPTMMYMNTMWFDLDQTRQRAIVIGASRAFLLDEFLPDWKEMLVRRAALSPNLNELLRSAVTRKGKLADSLPAKLVSEYDQRAGSRIRKYSSLLRDMVHDWDVQQGYRLVVDAYHDPLIATGFDRMNIVRLEDNRLFHLSWLKLSNLAGGLEVTDQASLTAPAGNHPLFDGIARVEIAGLDEPPVAEENGDSLIVRWSNGELHFARATLEDLNGTMSIRL